MGKTKILIDTDIGNDVDDALAIALALNAEEIDLLGVTTVFKNTEKRAQLAMALLEQYGRADIPVFAGCSHPLNGNVDTTEVPPQYNVLDKTYDICNHLHAVDFIIDTIRKDPSVVICPIGAMTNIAIAMMKNPEIMKSSRIVAMGGIFSRVFSEWNIFCDPEAAQIVLNTAENITMIGLDVTTKCVLDDKDMDNIKTSTRKQRPFLNKLIKKWFEAPGNRVFLHDPLVIGYLIKPDLLEFQNRKVIVETSGVQTRGITFCPSTFDGIYEEGNIKVASSVHANAFNDLFMEKVFL